MEDPRMLIGVCGLYCGACYHHCAASQNGRHLLAEASRQGRDLQGFICAGCRSNTLYVHPGCSKCEIRVCADARGVEHCGQCANSPCSMLSSFQQNGRPHHLDVLTNLKSLTGRGPDAWLTEQQTRWTCQCGARFSWYETSCHACGAPLSSYGADTE